MEIDIFGKSDCVKCETAKDTFTTFLSDRKLKDKISLRYYDMESVDGMAEGAFNDVMDIPTIIITKQKNRIARWDGNVPETGEIEAALV